MLDASRILGAVTLSRALVCAGGTGGGCCISRQQNRCPRGCRDEAVPAPASAGAVGATAHTSDLSTQHERLLPGHVSGGCPFQNVESEYLVIKLACHSRTVTFHWRQKQC